ncbi:MAG: site-2 protease family protein [Elusimicrobiota bacterium]
MDNIILYQHIFGPLHFVSGLWPLVVVLFFFSVVLHEVAHGYMAYMCGDNTAKAMGRITLNPLAHIDVLGTLIVPVVLYMLGGVIIGWAKPVPVNPHNFYDLKKDTLKVGASGPLMNFALAIVFSLIVWIMNLMKVYNTDTGFMLIALVASGVSMNIVLGLFNLIPIPPLDGSRIVSSLLPAEAAYRYEKIAPYGFFILILMIGVLWRFIILFGNVFYKLLFMGLPL